MQRKDWDKLAENYHDFVISPFQDEVQNPLFKKLEEIEDAKNKTVMDVGCGRGEILDKLASIFKKVYAVDFSPKMIEHARKISKRKNIEFFVKDMRELSEFKNKCDVVIAVNSVLGPKTEDTKQALDSIYESMKEESIFYGIFPSMESIIYQGFLIFDKELEEKDDEKKALISAKRQMERNKYDFIEGTYDDNGDVQKFYYRFELVIRLKDAGFKTVKTTKVLYPWGETTGDFLIFPGKPMMWDWFVTAHKEIKTGND